MWPLFIPINIKHAIVIPNLQLYRSNVCYLQAERLKQIKTFYIISPSERPGHETIS